MKLSKCCAKEANHDTMSDRLICSVCNCYCDTVDMFENEESIPSHAERSDYIADLYEHYKKALDALNKNPNITNGTIGGFVRKKTISLENYTFERNNVYIVPLGVGEENTEVTLPKGDYAIHRTIDSYGNVWCHIMRKDLFNW